MRGFPTAAALVVLAGCATDQTKIVRREAPSTDYSAYAYRLSSPQGEVPYQVFLRPYNDSGKLVVCGYLTGGVAGAAEARIESWWQSARLSLNGHDIGTGHFLKARRPGDVRSTCVETPVAWKDEFQSVPLRLRAKGPDGSV